MLQKLIILSLLLINVTYGAPNCEKGTFCYFGSSESVTIRASPVDQGLLIKLQTIGGAPKQVIVLRNTKPIAEITCDPENGDVMITTHSLIIDETKASFDSGTCRATIISKSMTSSDVLSFQHENQTSDEFTIESLKPVDVVSEEGLTKDQRRMFSKAHAILMIIGWLFFVPTGFLFARFGRDLYEGQTLFGMAVWFQIHRVSNFLGVVCICASMLCIFISQRWTWKGTGSGSKYWTEVHTDLGVISSVLAVAQPINSWFRCGPSHSHRPVFNWAHRITGILSYSLAVTAIIIAAINFRRIWNEPLLELVLVNLPTALCLIAAIGFPILEGSARKTAYGTIRGASKKLKNQNREIAAPLLITTSTDSDSDIDNFDTNAKPRRSLFHGKGPHILRIPVIFWSVGIFCASAIALSLLVVNGYKNV